MTLHHELHGPPGAPTILFSPGLGGSARYWEPHVAAFLAAGFRVLLYDHRGTGRSPDTLPPRHTIDDMATDALAVLDAAGIARAHMVGHAIGALIALAIAGRAPGRLHRLVLINAWTRMPAPTLRCFEARLALLRHAGREAFVAAQPIFLYPARFLAEQAARIDHECAAALSHLPPDGNIVARIDAARRFDAGDLSALGHQALVIAARDDVLVPDLASEALAAALPRARLVRLDGGHACNVTAPRAFETICLAFLEEGQELRP